MKLKFLVIALLISAFSYSCSANATATSSDTINNQNIFDIYEAHEKAMRLNKPIFYVVASANCSHCVTFLQKTIRPVFEDINRNFVFALSDLTKGDKVPSNIPFNGTTPSTYILSPDGKLLTEPIEGNFNLNHLQLILRKLYEAYGQ